MIQNSLIKLSSFTPISLQAPDAWVGHLPFAAWIMQEASPKIFVELGTHSGNSYFSFCQSVAESGISAKCYAVDTWQGDEHAGLYSDEIFAKVHEHNQENYADFSRLLRMTFDDAVSYFADESIDLLHIDGLHTYEAVRHDFETWLPKLALGAVVIFHDTNVRERNFGVWKLWEELQTRYPNNLEFVHSHGLGVLQLNNASEAKKLDWLQSDSFEKQGIIDYFSSLGALQLKHFQLKELKQQVASHNLAFTDFEVKLGVLSQTLWEREGQINELSQTLGEREGQINELSQTLWEREGQINELSQTLGEREGQINELSQTLGEREGQINELSQTLGERDKKLEKLLSSKSWQISKPLRWISRVVRGDFRQAVDPIKKLKIFNQLFNAYSHVKKHGGIISLSKKASHYFIANGFKSTYIKFAQTKWHEKVTSLINEEFVSEYSVVLDGKLKYQLVQNDRSRYTFIKLREPKNLKYFDQTLKFSVVVPVYNTPVWMLRAAIDSVLRQWYSNWELILVDDASTSPELLRFLESFEDVKVRKIKLSQNLGIAGATNVGIGVSHGEYVVFMDHDDELTEDCLYELAKCAKSEDSDYIYSDEDKIDEKGQYVEPHFKPSWSPDTIMSTMYVCHVTCVKRAILDQIKGIRDEVNGCQDWDLVLRVAEITGKISHIPKVLYHWRILPESIASNISAKPYVMQACIKVREDALKRRGLNGSLEELQSFPGYFRVNYKPYGTPKVSIVIPTRDNPTVLERCINSIQKISSWQNYEIVIVDNGSVLIESKELFLKISKYANIKVIRYDAPFNFSELNNFAANQTKSEILLFLNDDTEVISPDWMERMIGYAQLEHVGAVGAKLLYPDGLYVQHAGVLNLKDGPGHAFLRKHASEPGYYLRNQIEYNWLAVTGACLMIEREKFINIGGFDEKLPVAYNDVDLCISLYEKGFYNLVVQAVNLIHHESLTRGVDHIDANKKQRLINDKIKLFNKHPFYRSYDPFFNPNLHPNGINFEIIT